MFRGTASYYTRYRPGYPLELLEELGVAAGLDGTGMLLDLGCGPGTIAIPLARHVEQVVAVDREPEMLEELRRLAPANVVALEASAEDVDASWGTFRLATIGRALHWFDGELVLARLVGVTPAVALLGDSLDESEALRTVLEIARELLGERSPMREPGVRYEDALAASAFSRGRRAVGDGRAHVDGGGADRLRLLDLVRIRAAGRRTAGRVRGGASCATAAAVPGAGAGLSAPRAAPVVTDWEAVAAAKGARYEAQHGELDERALVRLGNVAYAAGLALLMAGSAAAVPWLDRAAARWRESWDRGAATDAWGRPVGALKAALLAGDERSVGELARWTLSLGPIDAASSIGLYAATLALLALGRFDEATASGMTLCGREDFPGDVAGALTAIAAGDHARLSAAVGSVVAVVRDAA